MPQKQTKQSQKRKQKDSSFLLKIVRLNKLFLLSSWTVFQYLKPSISGKHDRATKLWRLHVAAVEGWTWGGAHSRWTLIQRWRHPHQAEEEMAELGRSGIDHNQAESLESLPHVLWKHGIKHQQL